MTQELLERPSETPPRGVLQVDEESSLATIKFEGVSEQTSVEVLSFDRFKFTFGALGLGELISIEYPIDPNNAKCEPLIPSVHYPDEKMLTDESFAFEITALFGPSLLTELEDKTALNTRHAIYSDTHPGTLEARRLLHQGTRDGINARDTNRKFERRIRSITETGTAESKYYPPLLKKAAGFALAAFVLMSPAWSAFYDVKEQRENIEVTEDIGDEINRTRRSVEVVLQHLESSSESSQAQAEWDTPPFSAGDAILTLSPHGEDIRVYEAIGALGEMPDLPLGRLPLSSRRMLAEPLEAYEEESQEELLVNQQVQLDLERNVEQSANKTLRNGALGLIALVPLGSHMFKGPSRYAKRRERSQAA